jgi:hypothetical protein
MIGGPGQLLTVWTSPQGRFIADAGLAVSLNTRALNQSPSSMQMMPGKSLTTSLKRKRRALMISIFDHPSLALQACKPGSYRLGPRVRSTDPAL